MTKLAILIQRNEIFPDAYDRLSKEQQMSAPDQWNKLSPFLDENGLLRLQVRLQNASSSYGVKHSILLSAKHYKLIAEAHQATFHEGLKHVRSILRLEYWSFGL